MARELQQAGWLRARALRGGWVAWQGLGLPIEPKPIEAEPSAAGEPT